MKLVLSLMTASLVSMQAAEKPNILFIFADDLAYDCVGAYGNKEVKTPHLDKLSTSGTQFTYAYNSGAWHGAVCVASRTMLMTGKQIWNAKATKLTDYAGAGKFWSQRMQKAGYTTYFAGKWHVGSTSLPGKVFNHAKNVRPGMPNQTKERYNRNFTPGQDDWSPFDKSKQGFWKGGKHWSEVLADDATSFFKQAKGDDKPFFMVLCFNAPHDPRQAPESYQKMYPYKNIEVPGSYMNLYPHEIGSNRIRDEKLGPFPRTKYSVQVNRSEYYALISHMDTQIGRILDELKKTGKADNTIIIFSADHGLACGHHGLLGKQNMYDHSVRVPWIISGPGIPVGKSVDAPIYLQDAMATSLALAGANNEGVEFKSVLPMIKGKESREQIYSCYTNHQRMIRVGDYKLISYPRIKVEKLFNIKVDPFEEKDLAKDPAQAQRIKELRAQLVAEMKKMNDPVDLNDPIGSYGKSPAKKRKNKKAKK